MKRTAAIILVIALIVTFTACGKEEVQETVGGGEIVGGWTLADGNTLTDEQLELFKKAMEQLDGVDYTAVAYIGSQVVAGTNHLFLTRALGVYPGAVEKYALVKIYEDLDGNLEILEILNSEAETGISDTDGSWAVMDDFTVTGEIMEAFGKATETLTGAELTPVCVLAKQTVAGTNYMLFCETKPSVNELAEGNDGPQYAMVSLYVDLDGNAELTNIYDFVLEG